MHLIKERRMRNQRQNGFGLLELMVSMVIGIFLLSGVFTIFVSSTKTQRAVSNETEVMSNARFAIEAIAYDLRHAGGYGYQNYEDYEKIHDITKYAATTITGQCDGPASGWAMKLDRPVYAVNDSSDYSDDCMADWAKGDSIEMRYATPVSVDAAANGLIGGTLYLQSVPKYSYFFKVATPPDPSKFQDGNARNFVWRSKAYYVADHTDIEDDGIPSLRLLSLESDGLGGMTLTKTVLLSGVENLQIQFGLDTPGAGKVSGDQSADIYLHPNQIDGVTYRWNQVISARIWLLMRSREPMDEVKSTSTYSMAGVDYVNGDQYKRTVVSTSVRFRNINTGEL